MHYGHKLFISPRKNLEVEVCDAGCKGNMLGARLVQPNLFKAGGPAAIGQSTPAEHCGRTVPDYSVWCLEFSNAGRPYSPWSDYKRLDRANHLPRPFYVIILASLRKQDALTFILLPELLNNNNNNKSLRTHPRERQSSHSVTQSQNILTQMVSTCVLWS